jgi:probable HAF family extracellular repeat protein
MIVKCTSKRLIGIAATASVFTAWAASASPRYQEVDLAAAVDTFSSPFAAAIDNGIVAVNGFVLVNDNWEPLSVLYAIAAGRVVHRFPAGDRVAALSGNGDVVGDRVNGEIWLVRGGVRTTLPVSMRVLRMNDQGQVVGFGGFFFPRAMLFNIADGTATDLGTLGGLQSVALDINDDGQIAGGSNPAGTWNLHAVRWFRGVMQDLGTLGGANSFGNAIDAEGRIAGSAETTSGNRHAVVFEKNRIRDLGTLPGCTEGEASAMNEAQEIVGFSRSCGTSVVSRAFLHTGDAMFDLNDLTTPAADGFIYSRPTGIDDAGNIIGQASSPDGLRSRMFLLVPAGHPH